MRISVGVPAYNQGQYLAETLDSLLSQTVPPDEIVVSDNHSADMTAEVLRRYDGQLRIIRPPEHLPMVAHWNYVVENLSGDWFSLLSSDDVATPDFIRHLSRAQAIDGKSVLVRGGWSTILPSGRRIRGSRLLSTSSVTEAPRTFIEQLGGPKASFAAFMCRRSAWVAVGGFPSALRLYGDWGLWLRLSAVGDFVTTHRIVSIKRGGYPTWRDLERAVDGAHDEREIALNIIASVAEHYGPAVQPLVELQTARRLTLYLSQMTELSPDPLLRSEIEVELRPLAAATRLDALLDDFAAGQPIRCPERRSVLTMCASVMHAQLQTAVRHLHRPGASR